MSRATRRHCELERRAIVSFIDLPQKQKMNIDLLRWGERVGRLSATRLLTLAVDAVDPRVRQVVRAEIERRAALEAEALPTQTGCPWHPQRKRRDICETCLALPQLVPAWMTAYREAKAARGGSR